MVAFNINALCKLAVEVTNPEISLNHLKTLLTGREIVSIKDYSGGEGQQLPDRSLVVFGIVESTSSIYEKRQTCVISDGDGRNANRLKVYFSASNFPVAIKNTVVGIFGAETFNNGVIFIQMPPTLILIDI